MREQKKWILGYDFNDSYVQISFYDIRKDAAVTAGKKVGDKSYQIPTALCRNPDNGIWLFGQEAVTAMEQEGYPGQTHLLTCCLEGTKENIDGCLYEPEELLAIFISRTLQILGAEGKIERVSRLTAAVPEISQEILQVFSRTIKYLKLEEERFRLMDYGESFFYYMVNQESKLWDYASVLFSFENNVLKAWELKAGSGEPKIVTVSQIEPVKLQPAEQSYPAWEPEEYNRLLDQEFCSYIRKIFQKRIISSVYLIGNGFDGGWMKVSLQILCAGRKVFQGKNLFTLGACYGAYAALGSGRQQDYFYVGEHQLPYSVGIKVQQKEGTREHILIPAGSNWYDVHAGCDLILSGETGLTLLVHPLNRVVVEERRIALEGMPERPDKTSRIRIGITADKNKKCRVSVTDMGFGELYAASGLSWEGEV